MNSQALTRATTLGLAAQLVMVIAGHFIEIIRTDVFALGGMAISAAAGIIYARYAHSAWVSSLVGGAIAGGVCALLGIAVSVVLKDTPAQILLLGTLGSAVAGLLGGAVGKLTARR
ncbi:MAG: hypothetical protein JWO33_1213 [Caulobacteraceae bacterium]|nr:hypothetical protein [Caulobacteraceae bacterium]